MRMCDDVRRADNMRPGQLTFTEAIGVLDCKPESLGHRDTVVFFNDSEVFQWEKSNDLCDVRTGVICSPNNYLYDSSKADIDKCLPDGVMRVTAIANYDKWANLPEERYQAEKMRWFDRTTAAAVKFVPDYRGHIIDSDFFTPTTIKRSTHSRRIEPMTRSTYGFCHGDLGAVTTSSTPSAAAFRTNSAP